MRMRFYIFILLVIQRVNKVKSKAWIKEFATSATLSSINQTTVTCHMTSNGTFVTPLFSFLEELDDGSFDTIAETSTIHWSPQYKEHGRYYYRSITFHNFTGWRIIYCYLYEENVKKPVDKKNYNVTRFVPSANPTPQITFLVKTTKPSNKTLPVVVSVVSAVVGAGFFAAVLLIVVKYKQHSKIKHKQTEKSHDIVTDDRLMNVKVTNGKLLPESLLFNRLQATSINKEDYEFDVNICYAPVDFPWVHDELVPCLENAGLTTCLDKRDYTPGLFEVENMTRAIERSLKTVAVLSPEFLSACDQQLQTALSCMAHHYVVPVLYRATDLPPYLNDRTYLEWGQEDVQPHFWTNLLRAVAGNDAYHVNVPC